MQKRNEDQRMLKLGISENCESYDKCASPAPFSVLSETFIPRAGSRLRRGNARIREAVLTIFSNGFGSMVVVSEIKW